MKTLSAYTIKAGLWPLRLALIAASEPSKVGLKATCVVFAEHASSRKQQYVWQSSVQEGSPTQGGPQARPGSQAEGLLPFPSLASHRAVIACHRVNLYAGSTTPGRLTAKAPRQRCPPSLDCGETPPESPLQAVISVGHVGPRPPALQSRTGIYHFPGGMGYFRAGKAQDNQEPGPKSQGYH